MASLAEHAYVELKRRILSGEFALDPRLREVEVAEALAMSRTPVRDALRRLESEGLVQVEQRRGLVVTSLDQQAMIELYEMREALEGTAAALAARHAGPAEVMIIGNVLDAELEAVKAKRETTDINHRFHQAIYDAAHNRFLIRALHSLIESTYLLGRSTLADRDRTKVAADEHRRIFEAIRTGNAAKAEAAAREHIRAALGERLKMLASATPTRPARRST